MKKFYSALLLLLCMASTSIYGQNLGFEATPATSPPNNWTAVTGTWTVNTNPNYVRTGLQSMTITDPATTGTTLGNSSPVITTTSPGYLITIGWGKSNTANNALFHLGYRLGTANTLNPSITSSGQPANLNDVTWSRIISVSTNSALAANNYGVSLRAFRSAATAGTEIYVDDIIIYPSTSNIPDLTAPNPASGAVYGGNTMSWTNGTDNGSPASGIGGVVIIRANGASIPPPTLNDQAMYDPAGGAAGVDAFTDGNGFNWTVVANIQGSTTTSFSDATAGAGPYTYVIYMRDMAYNYSAGLATGVSLPCSTPPTPGTTTSSATSIVCGGTNVTIGVTGSSFGSGQTYQLQESSSQTGPFTNVGTPQSVPSFNVQPATTTWYQIELICGATSAISTPVQVLVQPAVSGNYTINSGQPTGGTNFQSFADAINFLGCGISGPIVFDVVPGSGPYTEQVVLPSIMGSSATNTITFNGNGETLQFSPPASDRYIWKMDGSDYVNLKKLRIVSQSATYGWGVFLTNGADNNIIDSLTIDMSAVTSTTLDNSAGIVIATSHTDLNSDGSASNNTIRYDTIIGGYHGIIMNGFTGALDAVGNMIDNNLIQDFYAKGIELTETDGTIVSNNDINRATRTAVTTFYGIEFGAGNKNGVAFNNRIHNTHDAATTQTGTAYGIYTNGDDAPVGSENRFYNNLIYNFNSGSGAQYGIYNTGANGNYYYHNTIVLDNPTSTSGTTVGFYQTTLATNIEFRNNIIYITRGGTGTKNLIDFVTNTSSIVSNNNILYLNAPAGTNYYGSWGTSDYSTLATWQGANGNAFDQQSSDVDPMFLNPAANFYYPNNQQLTTVGSNVGVTNDVVGTLRSLVSPTPGAYEIQLSTGADMGVKNMVLPIQQTCYTGTQTFTVRVVNYSANTHNFVTDPVTVNSSVTGPNAQTFTPVVISTGTLASGDSLDVVITTTYSMAAPGTYTFNASTSVTGDGNTINNGMLPTVINVAPLEAGTLASNPEGYCVTGGIPTLSVTGNSGGTIQWQEASSLAGPWTNVGTGGNSYTPAAAISASMYYRTIATCGSNTDTSDVLTVAVNNPQLLTTTPGVRCGPGSVTLGATGSAGSDFNWYTAATGGVPIGTGATFNTPVISTTTTYYVAASNGGGGLQSVGPPNLSIGSAAVVGTYYVNFTVLAPLTIQSVDAYFNTVGSAFTLNIRDANTSASVFTYSGTTTVSGTSTPQVIPINATLQPGTYQMGWTTDPGTYRVSTGASYPYTLPGLISITGNTFNDPNYFYYFFNWQIVTGCESPRQAVVATVNNGPAFDITNDLTVCNNAITPIAVNSTLSDFNEYTWTPVGGGLFSDAAATTPITASTNASTVYARFSVPGTYTIIASANNTVTTCQNFDSLKLTVLPATVSVVPANDQLCVSGSTTLDISPNPASFGNATYQWYSSPDNVNYTAITGATASSYTTPTINSTTYYRVEIKTSGGTVCVTAHDTVFVSSPQILTTTPDALCGPGVMTVSATADAGSTINWYDAPNGGNLLHTGPSYTTPNLTSTATYYAAALQGGAGHVVGVTLSDITNAICGIPTSTTTTNYALRFTTTKPVVINSIYFIPAAAGSVTINLMAFPASGTLATVSPSFTAGQVGQPQLVNLGFSIPNAGDYQLVMGSGGSHRITTMGCGFPMATPTGGFVITGAATSSTAAANTTSYNSFYHINVTEACESPRVPVTAMVSGITTITRQPENVSSCVGAQVNLSVAADGANLTYQWFMNGNPISGATDDTLTLNPVTLADAGTYSVNITGLCGNASSQTVTLNVSAANTWIGQVSNDWHDPANWCGGVPTPTSDVEIFFAGTFYQPVVDSNTTANVRSLTIHPGAMVKINGNGVMNIHGHFVNNGTFTATGSTINFQGTASQNVSEIIARNITVNNAAGVVLTGNMTASNNLTLTSGHLTLGINNLSVGGAISGNAANHIITNSVGSVVMKNVNTTAVIVPVGHSATAYNPVTIANGGGRDFSVRVALGINPSINIPGVAVNRTWYVSPDAPVTGASISLQYADAEMNGGVPTNPMEVSAHDGTSWNLISPAGGIVASGNANARTITVTTSIFGSMVVGNVGSSSWITSAPNVDPTIGRMVLMPNLVQSNTVLRVVSTRATRINWSVIDQNGRVVMSFSKQVMIGQNDIQLEFSKLASGVYNITGFTDKGNTQVLRFVKM